METIESVLLFWFVIEFSTGGETGTERHCDVSSVVVVCIKFDVFICILLRRHLNIFACYSLLTALTLLCIMCFYITDNASGKISNLYANHFLYAELLKLILLTLFILCRLPLIHFLRNFLHHLRIRQRYIKSGYFYMRFEHIFWLIHLTCPYTLHYDN